MSYYDYYSSRSSKPSHTGGDAHNGSFEQGRRTILPPLTIAFPTSDSPGLSFHVTPPHVPVNSIPFNTVSGTHSSPHPHPTQPHPTYVQPQFRACLTVGESSLIVLTPNAKMRLPSSKRMLDTASTLITSQVRTSRLPTRGTKAAQAVRRTTTTEPHLPLTRQTLGGSRL